MAFWGTTGNLERVARGEGILQLPIQFKIEFPLCPFSAGLFGHVDLRLFWRIRAQPCFSPVTSFHLRAGSGENNSFREMPHEPPQWTINVISREACVNMELAFGAVRRAASCRRPAASHPREAQISRRKLTRAG